MRSWMTPLAVLALVCVGCNQSKSSSDFSPYEAQAYGSSDTQSTLAALEPMDRPVSSSSTRSTSRSRSTPPNWEPGKMRYDAVIPVERVAHLDPSPPTSSPEPRNYDNNAYSQSYSNNTSSSSYDEPLSPRGGAGRTHTVGKGDTLYSLARRYYNSDARWRDIYNANSRTLSSPDALRIGMRLVIP